VIGSLSSADSPSICPRKEVGRRAEEFAFSSAENACLVKVQTSLEPQAQGEMCRINNAPALSAAVVDGDAISALVGKDGRFEQQQPATAGMFYWDAGHEEPHRQR